MERSSIKVLQSDVSIIDLLIIIVSDLYSEGACITLTSSCVLLKNLVQKHLFVSTNQRFVYVILVIKSANLKLFRWNYAAGFNGLSPGIYSLFVRSMHARKLKLEISFYCTTQLGLRLSKNALIPSRASAFSTRSAKFAAAYSITVRRS